MLQATWLIFPFNDHPSLTISHDQSFSDGLNMFECEPEVNWLFRKMVTFPNQSNVLFWLQEQWSMHLGDFRDTNRVKAVFLLRTSYASLASTLTHLWFWKRTGGNFSEKNSLSLGRRINAHLLGWHPSSSIACVMWQSFVLMFTYQTYQSVSIPIHPLNI